jgi:hypothetical protein
MQIIKGFDFEPVPEVSFLPSYHDFSLISTYMAPLRETGRKRKPGEKPPARVH